MNKKLIKKELSKLGTQKASFDDSLFEYDINGNVFKVLILKSSSNTQITINSPTVIEVAKGKLNGIRYIKQSSNIYRFDSKEKSVLIFLKGKPYRILKYLNENQIVDISSDLKVHNMNFIYNLEGIESIVE